MRRYSGAPFDLEILMEDGFTDYIWTVNIIVIQLNDTAHSEWVNVNNGPERDLLAWEEKILAKLECPPDTICSITQARGDIFTVVINEMADRPKAATLTDKDVTRYLWLVDRKLSLLTSGIKWKPEYGPELEAIDKEIKELRGPIDQEHARRKGSPDQRATSIGGVDEVSGLKERDKGPSGQRG